MAVIYVYFSMFQKVDEEEYGGISEIFKEGLMTSFATFVVSQLLCLLLNWEKAVFLRKSFYISGCFCG